MTSPKRAALVTGAAHRLGRHIALGLAQDGFDIALHYGNSHDRALSTAEEIRALGVSCILVPFDLRNADGLSSWFQEVVAALPHLDTLINSASAYTAKPIAETSIEVFDTQFAVNIRAPFFLTQALAQLQKPSNAIQIIDNKMAYNQYAYAAYLLAKKTLSEFVPMAAAEFGRQGLRVNGIAPGIVMPSSSRSAHYLAWRHEAIPDGKPGNPQDIVRAMRYILSSPFVNGQILTVDGGENINIIGRHTDNYPGEANDPS